MTEYLYRFEQEHDERGIEIVLKRYKIVRHTKCGVWIYRDFAGDKFVNLNARKQYASKTQNQALEQFIHRKRRHISILDSQLYYANTALKMAIDLNNNDKEINDRIHEFDGFFK